MPPWPTHVRRLASVALFRSPRVRANRGRTIQDGREEIEFLVEGRAYFHDGGREIELGAGAMLWHQAGQRTVYRTDPGDPYACVVFSFEIERPPEPPPPRLSFPRDAAEARAFAMQLHDAFHRGDHRELLAAHAYLALRWRAQTAPAGGDARLPPALRAASACIAARYHEALTVAEIAAAAGLRPSQLHLLYRRHLRMTPWQALADQRVAEARRLLSADDLPVEDVGRRVGWRDPAHFGRIFRARMGMAPGAYRRRYRLPGA